MAVEESMGMAVINALGPLYALDHYGRAAHMSTLQMSNANSRSQIDQARDSNLAFSPDWAEQEAKQIGLKTVADTGMGAIFAKLAHGWPTPLTGGTK